jgi:hypothetical protein
MSPAIGASAFITRRTLACTGGQHRRAVDMGGNRSRPPAPRIPCLPGAAEFRAASGPFSPCNGNGFTRGKIRAAPTRRPAVNLRGAPISGVDAAGARSTYRTG